LLGLLVVAVVGGGAVYAFRAEIALAVMKRTVEANFAGDPLSALPDGLHVALCGAGSPMPDMTRSGPCVAIVAGKRLIIIDAGNGAARMLARMRLPPAQIERIFLTHFHSDHIDGLGELRRA
jgi:ribonuclease Z